MAAGLSARIGADDREFSQVLERSSRKFKMFGRDLEQGSAGINRLFGVTGKAASGMGQGFQLASDAIGIFAGGGGLLSIGASLASGGIVLAGMAALTYGMKTLESVTEATRSAVEQFNKELGRLPNNTRGLRVLESMERTLKNAAEAKRQLLAGQATPAVSAVGAAGLGTEIARQGGLAEFIKGMFGKSNIQQGLEQVQTELAKTTEAADDLRNALNTPEARAQALAERMRKLAEETERFNKAARSTNEKAMLEAWRFMQPGYIGGGVNARAALVGTQAINAAAQAAGRGGLNPLSFADLKPELFEPVREFVEGQKDEITAITSGFAELPGALAGILGPLIASVFGNSRGAQIGGTLGAAFAGGAGTFLGGMAGKAIGGALGAGVGSFIPVIGTAIGGLIGGALGGLFSHHRQSVDANTQALYELNKTLSLTNVPSGYKVERAAFRAQTSIVIDGREVARAVVRTLRGESQAQFGTTARWAEVSI